MYITKTDEIKNGLNKVIQHEIITLSINVDGTACVLIKQKDGRKYYDEKLTHEQMKMPVNNIVNLLKTKTEKEFKQRNFNKILTF